VPPRVLDADEIERQLNDLPAWSGDRESLRRTAIAADFPTAIRLVNEVAEIAEEMNHHPDMDIRWRRVYFTLRTHVSKGVTQYDIELAHRIERAVGELGTAGDAG
jgi:4a-hydroxytetrahydrobiopterin dehydratase